MEYLNDQNNQEFIAFEVRKVEEGVVLVHFELKRELNPEDLKRIKPPDPVKNKLSKNLLILSGRGPIWLYGFLIHFYHPVKAVAVFDPRLDGAVVVESHSNEFEMGSIIKLEG